jgi:hypothetical protein
MQKRAKSVPGTKIRTVKSSVKYLYHAPLLCMVQISITGQAVNSFSTNSFSTNSKRLRGKLELAIEEAVEARTAELRQWLAE